MGRMWCFSRIFQKVIVFDATGSMQDTIITCILSMFYAEAYAAKAAGIRAILLDRPGNAPLSQEDRAVFKVIKTFDEVNIKLPE